MGVPQAHYLCIDLKSFYASVECLDRGLDPLTTNLVVADPTRTDKTICLAASPSMKALGVSGRARVFEIPKGIDYIMAPPRMARYIERSADVYGVYLKHIAKEDIHVYSIDEAFFDIGPYLSLYGCTPRELGERIRRDVYETTGIPAACGLGTNLYLAKIALDITAKHSDDFFGELDEERYRAQLWDHEPITDFWRIGPGIARRLASHNIRTMGQVAMAPREMLFDEFGIDAEILIDHAWGVEPVEISDIKAYRSKSNSFSSAQILPCEYAPEDALVVAKEMAEGLALELVDVGRECAGVTLFVGYEALPEERELIKLSLERKQRLGPGVNASRRFLDPTSSERAIRSAVAEMFEEKVDMSRMVRRIGITVEGLTELDAPGVQRSLFSGGQDEEQERDRQRAINDIKRKYGKNAMLKALDLLPAATARERNAMIGGHRSGE